MAIGNIIGIVRDNGCSKSSIKQNFTVDVSAWPGINSLNWIRRLSGRNEGHTRCGAQRTRADRAFIYSLIIYIYIYLHDARHMLSLFAECFFSSSSPIKIRVQRRQHVHAYASIKCYRRRISQRTVRKHAG